MSGDLIEALHADGDEDAILVSQFENATLDAIQEDEELASCYTQYTKMLVDDYKNASDTEASGQPLYKGGKGKGNKGKVKGFQRSGKGQSLQSRILNSTCRLVERKAAGKQSAHGEADHW